MVLIIEKFVCMECDGDDPALCRAEQEQSIEDGSEATCSLDSGECSANATVQIHGHRELPTYVVLFQDMESLVLPFLSEHGYQLEKTFVQNPMEGQYVVLYKLVHHAESR